jgi:large subunit ribosomal protein L35
MPKLKTNSSAKKRFKVTGSGKVMVTQSGKRHNMRKRSKKMLLNAKGRTTAPETKMKLMKRVMPYNF